MQQKYLLHINLVRGKLPPEVYFRQLGIVIKMKKEVYWSWPWYLRWFCPLPLLIRLSKWQMGNHHVWYQDKEINLETQSRAIGRP